jgi:hypothetical protein
MLVGGDIFKDTNDEFSSGGSAMSSVKDSRSEKASVIEKIFLKVLGRKPSSRELAYYKYGILKEDDIRTKLLESDEHKKLVKDAKKLPYVEDEVKNVRVSERKLLQKIEDIMGEVIELKKLLEQKDQKIRVLRKEVENPYDLPTSLERFEEGFEVYKQTQNSKSDTPRTSSFKNRLIEIIDILFK